MSAGGSPGLELVLELVRNASGGRRCGSCGRSLAEAGLELQEVVPERIVVRAVCPCGSVEDVELRPASEEGRAELR
jgi:bacterioferritin-associated ferredoxin